MEELLSNSNSQKHCSYECIGDEDMFEEYFSSQVNNLLTKSNCETLYIFQGFARDQCRWLLNSKESILPEGSCFDSKGFLSIELLKASVRNLISQIVIPSIGNVRLMLYEQYLVLCTAVPDIKMLFQGEIHIVKNNLFVRKFPCILHDEMAQELEQFQASEKTVENNTLELCCELYSDINKSCNDAYFVSYIERHIDGGISEISLFPIENLVIEHFVPHSNLEICERQDLGDVILQIIQGIYKPTAFRFTEDREFRRVLGAATYMLQKLGLPYELVYDDLQAEEVISDDEIERYLPYLERLVGQACTFRDLMFYANPDDDNSTYAISQGCIIHQIVEQCEKVFQGRNDYRDIFITSPTGAGKSVLFQVPAYYIADHYNAVTLIITPLIALMKDQVEQLEKSGGECLATYINSTISYEERERRITRIRNGRYSLVYLSPELLLMMSLDQLLGKRRIGLIVVDEAHTVTLWGKDFRSDYWFLGDLLLRLRKNDHNFITLCLTATAVYGGIDDIVNETINTLNLKHPLVHLGNVRRDNIRFDIRNLEKDIVEGGIEEFKIAYTAEVIQRYALRGQKTLVYCPYTVHVNDLFRTTDEHMNTRHLIARYHGKMRYEERNLSQELFANGTYRVMICTKAFGMGINVKDIVNVYHFAPSGSLADYVQEVGRAARLPNIQGVAAIDFLRGDMRYARSLNGISEMNQYQLRDMLRKLYELYCIKGKKRNMLISPESFAYLFNEGDVDNKVKNGLLLLSKDLEETYGFPVLVVRPKGIFTTNYVNVPAEIDSMFRKKYGEHAQLLKDDTVNIIPPNRPGMSPTYVRNSGSIYEIDMAAIWEHHFSDISFGSFKYRFFSGELFEGNTGERPTPRMRITLDYMKPYDEVREILSELLDKLVCVFRVFADESKRFSLEEFKQKIADYLPSEIIKPEFVSALMDMFVVDVAQNIASKSRPDPDKFISTTRSKAGDSLLYYVQNFRYSGLKKSYMDLFRQCVPQKDNTYMAYLAFTTDHQPAKMKLFRLLEITNLATYNIRGGQNMEIFVRLNDPNKIKHLYMNNYQNSLLTDIRRRHRASQEIMQLFFTRQMDNSDRWDFIEQYFLGKTDELLNSITQNAIKKMA